MEGFVSHAGKILLAVAKLVRDQQPEDLSDEEIQVRESALDNNGSPFRGLSITYMGEQYSEGTIGTSDIGYLCGILFAKGRTGDAVMPDDRIQLWYELIRRRLQDQRSLVVIGDETNPREHVCIVLPGKNVTDPNKHPNYLLRQLVVAVWVRENTTSY